MTVHPGLEKEYALDFLSPVRYVASALEGASALSSDLERDYKHVNPGDLARVRRYEGLGSDAEANAFLVRRAMEALGDQIGQDEVDGPWHLTRPFEDLRYERRKLHLIENHHAVLRDPFNPMSGVFSENIRDARDKGDLDELRDSMRSFGWVPEFPALVDERGVVLVGHRRLQVAAELGIEPVKQVVVVGAGDAADARRLRLALVSNLGFKEMTPGTRKRIAEHLYEDAEWTMQRIAEALGVAQQTISNDLAGLPVVGKPARPKGGRPKGSGGTKTAEWQNVHDPIVRDWIAGVIDRNEAVRRGKATGLKPCSNGTYDARRAALEVGAATEKVQTPAPVAPEPVTEPEDDAAAFVAAADRFVAKWGMERVRDHFCG